MKVTRIVTGIVAVAILALVVNDAVGQDEGRRRGDRGGERGGPGGGRGGPGGFGGGGFGGGGFGGGRGGPGGGRGGQIQDPTMQLLRVEAVREELELLPDQVDALAKISENARSGFQRPDFDFRNATEEERGEFFEKMQEQLRERAEEMQAQLEEVLLPEQYDRLKELGVQVMGMRALSLDRVADELGISDSQKEELADVTASVQDKVREMMSSGNRDRDAMRAQMEEIREGVESDLMDVLTADQRKSFEEMKGKPFEFPEGAMGRGGPGGGRGGPGGGRGGFGGGRGGPGGGRGGPGGPDGGGRGGERQRPSFE